MKRRFPNSTKCDSTHCDSLLASLKKLKRNGAFCDVTIKSGITEIKAHRNVLASASDYFENLFLTSETDGYVMLPVVDFSDLPSAIIEQCIDYIYSGEIDFSGKNTRLLLKASERMHLHVLSKLCVEVLAEMINLDNCFEVVCLVHCRGESSLDALVKQFLFLNVRAFVKHPTFIHLKLNELIYCLALLQGGSRDIEVEKWNGVLIWVNYDLYGRQKFFFKLFGMINMAYFSKGFLRQILDEPLVKSSSVCLQGIASIVTEESFGCSSIAKASEEQKVTHIIACKIGSQVIVKFDVTTKKWSRFTAFPGHFNNHCDVISHGNNVFIGTGNQIYTFVNGKWDAKIFRTTVTCTRCTTIFCHVGRRQNVVEFAGSIWMPSLLSPQKVEIETQMITCVKCHHNFMYNSPLDIENSWRYPPSKSCYNRCIVVGKVVYMLTLECLLEYSMNTQKISCQGLQTGLGSGFFVAASENKIFAMGGFLSEKQVYEYDLATKKCCKLAAMITDKPTGHAFWHRGALYTLGGLYPSNLEQYNTCKNQWCFVPDVTIPREPVKIFVGDALYLVDSHMGVERINLDKLKSLNCEDYSEADANTIICPVYFRQDFHAANCSEV